jgi:hypothetical protein
VRSRISSPPYPWWLLSVQPIFGRDLGLRDFCLAGVITELSNERADSTELKTRARKEKCLSSPCASAVSLPQAAHVWMEASSLPGCLLRSPLQSLSSHCSFPVCSQHCSQNTDLVGPWSPHLDTSSDFSFGFCPSLGLTACRASPSMC